LKNPILSYVVNPRLIIVLLAAADLTWLCFRSQGWGFHRNIFLAIWVLVASIMLLLNRTWSNVAALFLSSYLPNSFVFAFWMYAYDAEVRSFSVTHFRQWSAYTQIDVWPLSCLGISILVVGVAGWSLAKRRQ
jgi:hypothetical protein